MLYRGVILGFLLVGLIQTGRAQSGVVEVQKDSLISLLQEFRAENGINPTTARMVSLGSKAVDKKNAKRVKVRGFRVQIFSGSSRNEAYAVQARFQNSYKDFGCYVTYEEPNYRVKVGDFRSRSEATSFMRELRSQYSNVFVFTEDVWAYE
ncbi:sporulation related protein [Sphingobacterium allocomposti]|uniref:Sporulation related protein n=1 Tax=Sphingobacterium allocomposti TaxID=415956 RepID=A0A5S5D2G8_9SPHI|nr:SPOR domain-containing protein [Sphingobacterium composti Yoo et al. 2007 non Ten et al. 2007]TYP88839.1 sporulation related protein [Sphingobacterium composti Yoo et al. 2007 non Ten et al. 2007]